MLMSAFVKVISIAFILVSFCAFVDKVSSAKFRARVGALLLNRISASRKHTIAQFISYFIRETIGHIYRGKAFSIRNFGVSAKLSLGAIAFFAAAICITNWISPATLFNLSGNFYSWQNFFLIAWLVIAGILTDALSFIQTAFFIRIAGRQQSIWDMIFLAVCDIVITINVFIIVFPLFLVPYLYLVDSWRNEQPARIGFDPSPISDEMLPWYADTERSQLSLSIIDRQVHSLHLTAYRIAFDVNTHFGGSSAWLTNFSEVHVQKMSPEKVVAMMLAELHATTQEVDLTTVSGGGLEKYRAHLKPKGIVATMPPIPHLAVTDPLTVYRMAYPTGHVIQDGFLSVLFLAPVKIDVNQMLNTTAVIFLPSPIASYFVVCDSRSYFTDDLSKIRNCSHRMGIAQPHQFIMAIDIESGMINAPGGIPVTVFAASSLFLTFAFYVSLFVMGITLFLNRLFGMWIKSGNIFDVEKYPLTAAAIFVIVLALPTLFLIEGISLVASMK